MSVADLIDQLNPKIRGWANYHRHVVSKSTSWPDGKCIGRPSRAATTISPGNQVSCRVWFKDLIDLKPDGCAFHFVGSNPSHSPKACMTFARIPDRSEEHTSELQSQSNLVCRLLLEKKKY